jgi:hypothetical protein
LSEFGYTSDCRIFNDATQDALGIVTKVLADYSMSSAIKRSASGAAPTCRR